MFTEEGEFIFLLLLLDSGLFYMLNSVSRWILLRRNRRMKIFMAMMTGPTTIIRFWPQQRLIAFGSMSFDLFSKSDDWCLEFLRFTKEQICEMTYILCLSYLHHVDIFLSYFFLLWSIGDLILPSK